MSKKSLLLFFMLGLALGQPISVQSAPSPFNLTPTPGEEPPVEEPPPVEKPPVEKPPVEEPPVEEPPVEEPPVEEPPVEEPPVEEPPVEEPPVEEPPVEEPPVEEPEPEGAYYVSGLTGDDANDGSKNHPWKTINRVNEEKFDNSTILFKRGEIFRGTINSYKFQTGLTFGAYGSGDNPIIAGSVEITDWKKTKHPALGKKVYEADVSAFIVEDDKGNENKIQHLFVNGELMTIARYPNVDSPADKNWLKVEKSAGKDAFTDPALVDYAKPDGYWKDAILRIRTYSWYYKVFKITGYTEKNGKITAKGLGDQLPDWGYFLDDKLEELDHPGEWYYDAQAKKVYFYPRGDVDPNTLLIEGSTYKTGLKIFWHEDNSAVENLTFRHFTSVGVSVNTSDNVTVRNCHFEYNSKGVSVWKSANVLVTDNIFKHQLNNAIGLSAPSDFDVQTSAVEKNQITNTGLFPLYCTRYEGVCYGTAISVFGKGQTVRQNTIENTGWIGIYLKGGHHLIEKNVVRKALLLLNDGGAIQIGSNGNIIRENFLFESLGNVDESNGCASSNSTPCSHHPTYGMGIGADNNFRDNIIEGNTVANNPDMGIRLNAFINTVVRNNVVYNNDPQIVIKDDKGPSRDNVVEGNIIYSLSPEQRGLVLSGATNHGTFNKNFYCNPYNETVFVRDGKQYALAHWKKAFPPYDKNAKWCGERLEEYSVSKVVDANLLSQSTLQMALQTGKNSSKTTNRFALRENQYYRLTFGVLGNGFGALRVRVNSVGNGTEILKATTFAYDSTHKDYEMFFWSPRVFDEALLVFTTTKAGSIGADTIELDNLSFEPVDAVLNDATRQSVLFTNPTENDKTISLEGTTYRDLSGKTVTGSITLAPFSSQILIYDSGERPPAFANMQATPLSVEQNAKTVTVSWEPVEGAAGYRLYYAPYPYTGPDSIADIDMGNQTTFSLELPSGVAFYVAVTAYNELDESDFSNIESFVIP